MPSRSEETTAESRTAGLVAELAISVAPPGGFELFDLRLIDGRLPAPVHAGSLRLRDSLKLPLATQVSFELGEYAEHIEEAFAGGGAGVDRLC